MERSSYPSDLTDEPWSLIRRRIPPAKPGGRPREVDTREVINALLYLTRNGCTWRALPHEFPPWRTVYDYFQAYIQDGTWETIHDALRDQVRHQAGRAKRPRAAIIDRQSVKTTEQRGSAPGTTRGRRSSDASGTSPSTRWG
jgi:putative transposase